jgi:hypothetical protein
MIPGWWFGGLMLALVLVVSVVAYGWGYRGWGPPYPRYMQSRRHRLASSTAGAPGAADEDFDPLAWGWGGDVVWLSILAGIAWSFWLSRH